MYDRDQMKKFDSEFSSSGRLPTQIAVSVYLWSKKLLPVEMQEAADVVLLYQSISCYKQVVQGRKE